jgi:hypothetical protein
MREQGDAERAFIDSGGGVNSGMVERPDEEDALVGFCIRIAEEIRRCVNGIRSVNTLHQRTV